MANNFLSVIRQANMDAIIAHEQQVTKAELILSNAQNTAARLIDDAAVLGAAEVIAASQPVADSKLIVEEAEVAGHRMVRAAEQWAAQARGRAARVCQAMTDKVAAAQEKAQAEADAAAAAILRRASTAVEAWETRLVAARRELDVFVAIQNPDEHVVDDLEAQFRNTVVRRRNLAVQRLPRRVRMAREKQNLVLEQYEARLDGLHKRAEAAKLYVLRIEERAICVVDEARAEAAQCVEAAQAEADEICRLAMPQVSRAEFRAAELRANAKAEGNRLIAEAQAALDEARAELDEARRLAPEAARELDNRRRAETLRKQACRLARAGQITDAMVVLAEAKMLDPASQYLPGCEKAIQAGLQAQQVKELVRQIEAAKTVAELDTLWVRATELGIAPRIESVWRGRMHKVKHDIQRKTAQTKLYASLLARHVAEPGQTVVAEKPGLVFVLDPSHAVVQMHQMRGYNIWKTVTVRGRM